MAHGMQFEHSVLFIHIYCVYIFVVRSIFKVFLIVPIFSFVLFLFFMIEFEQTRGIYEKTNKKPGIYVEISGKAYCHWTEGTGDNKKSYTGRETYLDERTYLVGGRGGMCNKV